MVKMKPLRPYVSKMESASKIAMTGYENPGNRGFTLLELLISLTLLSVIAVLIHFGHDGQLVGMLEVEQQVDGPTTAAHRHRLASNDGRERCQTLLTIQQKPRALVGVRALADREILQRHG